MREQDRSVAVAGRDLHGVSDSGTRQVDGKICPCLEPGKERGRESRERCLVCLGWGDSLPLRQGRLNLAVTVGGNAGRGGERGRGGRVRSSRQGRLAPRKQSYVLCACCESGTPLSPASPMAMLVRSPNLAASGLADEFSCDPQSSGSSS